MGSQSFFRFLQQTGKKTIVFLSFSLFLVNIIYGQCPVEASFSYTKDCNTISFQNNSAADSGMIVNQLWEFGDGTTSVLQDPPPHIFNPDNSYTVVLTVTDSSGCSDSDTAYININALPDADFSYSFNGCRSIAFTNLSGMGLSYHWDFGDGNTSTMPTPWDHVYNSVSSTTIYNITLTVSDTNGCVDSIVKPVTIYPDISADFTVQNNGQCSNDAVVFDATSSTGTVNYRWDFGDGNTSSSNFNPTAQHTYYAYFDAACTADTSYTVELLTTNPNMCADSTETQITLQRRAKPLLNDPNNPSNPFSNCSNNPNPSNPNYTITVENLTDMNCVDNLSIDWGDGTNITGLTNSDFPLTHTYTTLGVFQLNVTAHSSNGCNGDTTYLVGNQSIPASVGINTPDNTVGCAPQEFWFEMTGWENNSPGTSYIWDFGDSTDAVVWDYNDPYTNDTIWHTYTDAACNVTGSPDFEVTLTVRNLCMSRTTMVEGMYVQAPPDTDAETSADTVCVDEGICFTNLSSPGWGGYLNCDSTTFWTWNFGDGNSANSLIGEDTCYIYETPGTYTVQLTGDPQASSCGNVDTSFQVTVIDIHPEFLADTVCLGTPTAFTDLSFVFSDSSYAPDPNIPITSWYWDFGDSHSSNLQNPTHLYGNPGEYVVSLTVASAFGCDTTFTDTVFVDHLYIDSLQVSHLTCHNSNDGTITVYSSAGTNNITYTLNPGSIANNTGQFTNLLPGTYYLNVENSRGCDQQDTIIINNPPQIMIDSITSEDIICAGDNDGEIEIYASGGTGDLYFTLLPDSITNTSGYFNNLSGGTYTISVTDDNNCGPVISPDIEIIDPLPLVIDSLNITDISCHGQNDGEIFIQASGGTGSLSFTLQPGNISNTTGVFSSLTPGTYQISITDQNNCMLNSGDISITGANELEIDNMTSQDITCHGLNDGSITVTATGGTGALTYILQPAGISNSTGFFDNLAGGDYFVEVVDQNACSITSSNISITDPDIITVLSENFTDITCHGANDGSITINATGGTGILTYTLLPGNISNTTGVFNNLAAGIYTVSVTDQNSCNPAISADMHINDPEGIRVDSLLVTDLLCHGQSTGSIYAEGTGGTGILTYTLNPGGTTNTTGLFENLAAGTYSLEIADENNCIFTSTNITVNAPAELVFDNLNSTDITCNAANDGTITAVASGGTGSITYLLNPVGTTNTTGVFNNLPAGNYNITASDENSCSIVSSGIEILEPAALGIDSENFTNISCNGANDGSINIVATGGTGNIHYTLQPGNISNTSGSFNNLTAGTYTVSVTDDNNCGPVTSADIHITNPPAMVIDSETATNATCNGCNDGTIEVLASGGTGTLTYTLNPDGISNTSGVFTNLAPGSYNVVIEDENACQITSSNLIINEPGVFSIDSINVADNSCHNSNDGSISVYVSGGVTPYTFTLNPDGTTNGTGIFNNLLSGNYTVTITDGNGYSITTNQLSVDNPPAIVIDSIVSENISCFGITDGHIQAYASGGTGTLNYILLPVNDTNTTGYYNNLVAGTYRVAVTDMNACPEVISSDIVISEPAELTILSENATDMLCHDSDDGVLEVQANGGTGVLTYTLNPGGTTNHNGLFMNLSEGTYHVDVTDENGCSLSSSDLTINAPAELTIDGISSVDVSCYGLVDGSVTASASGGSGAITYTLMPDSISNSTGFFSNLPGGTYYVVITDANNCSVTSTDMEVNEPDEVLISNVDYFDISCHGANDGSITATASGGSGILTYTLQPAGISNTTGVFSNLTAGTYQVNVTDENNCVPAISADIIITDPPALVIDSATATDASCNGCDDGTIEVIVSGGTGILTYTLNPGGTTNQTGIFNDLAPGIYTVAIEDENACSISTSNLIINEPGVFSIDSLDVEHLSCFDAHDGSISVFVSGGVTPYTFTLNPDGTTNATGMFDNLAGGVYTITITDGNGYFITTNDITLINPPEIFIDSLNAEDISCFGANDGSMEVFATGGTGDLTYTLLPDNLTNNTGIFENLTPGTYHISVTDENNCGPAVSSDIVINEPPLLVIDSEIAFDCTCNGCDDGYVEVTASGGTGILTYTINPAGTSNTSGTFTGLAPGIYTVDVEDENECRISTSNLIIHEPAVFSIDSVNVEPLSCHNSDDGSIAVFVSGGVSPYTFTLSPSGISNNTGFFENLASGTYTITITDVNGNSTTSNPVDVLNPAPVVMDSVQSFDISCYAANDGIINAFASGGNSLYYVLLPVNDTNTSGTFNNLPAGTYRVMAADINNCPPAISSDIVIHEPAMLAIDSELTTDISCHNANDGVIEIMATGGTGILTYTIQPTGTANNTGIFTGLGEGTYSITVKDENGCEVTGSNLYIFNPQAISYTVDHENASCYGENDAFINISANGGTGFYTYSIDSGATYQTASDFNDLIAGTYHVMVRDSLLCETAATEVEITQPADLYIQDFTIINPTCNGCSNGQVTANVVGGTPPYTHSWSNGANGNPLTGLGAGTYTDTVTDANGCKTFATVTLTEPQLFELSLETHDVLCNAYSSGWAVAHVSGGTTPYSYEWRTIPGNNLLSTGDTLFSAPAGDYEITVTDAFNNALQQTFTLSEPSELILTTNHKDTICYGDANGWAAANVSGGTPPYSYQWSNGAQTDSISGLPAGTYTVIVTDNNNCEQTASVEIIENQELVLNTIVSDPNICYGSSTQLTASVVGGTPPYMSYEWTPAAGLTDPNSASTYASPLQNTFYTVTVIDATGCEISATAFVEVMEIPEAEFSYQYPCTDSLVYFADESTMLNGTINDWEWDFGDGTVVRGIQNPTHIFDDPGNYTVSLTVYESENGCSDTYTQSVQIHNLPDVDFSYGATCENEAVQFFNETIADTSLQSVFWDFGDPASGNNNYSTIQNPTHTYTQAGSYVVTLTVTDYYGCSSVYSESITISQEPVASFSYNGGCANMPVQFVDQSDPVSGTMSKWIWEYGDGTADTIYSPEDPNVSHLYSASGNYLVTLTVENLGGCTNSTQHTVIVDAVPLAGFSYDNDCNTELVEFTDLSDPNGGNNINQWKWNFGDPASGNYNVSFVQNPEHRFSAPGTYAVSLIVSNANHCADTIVQEVLIREGPGVDFTWENPCLGEETFFFVDTAVTPVTEIATWHWDFNDGSYSNEMNPGHQFPNNGVYDVELSVTDTNGCTASVTHQVAVRPLPIAFFDFSEPTCSTDSVYFNDLSSTEYGFIEMWVWDFGDGSPNDTIYFPNEPHKHHSFPNEGTFYVTLEVTNSFGCKNSFTDEVSVTEGPIANFYFSNACENEEVFFEDASFANGAGNIVAWDWIFDDPLSGVDNFSTEQNPSHIFSSPGSYDVRLIVTNFNNCRDTMMKTVVVKEAPLADFTWNTSCQNQAVQFTIDTSVTNTNVITDWFWDFGDGITSDLMEPQHMYEASGIYTVSLYVQDTGLCPNIITREITVHPEPVADFDFDAPSCQDSEIQFVDLSSTGAGYVNKWIWNYGDGVVDTIHYPATPDPMHVYDTSGSFDVTLTIVTTDSCESSVTKSINITPAPIADFEYEGACSDAPVQFSDLSVGNGGININQWYWDFGDPLSGQNNYSNQQNPAHTFSQPGTYNVTLIVVNNESCSDTIVKQVVSSDLPEVDFVTDSANCYQDITYFYADSTVIDIPAVAIFEWNFGDGSNPVFQQNAQHLYQQAGEYNVSLTITDTSGCVNTMIHNIEITPKPVAEYDYTNSCADDSTLFTDFSYTLNGENIIAWHWDFGDPASGDLNFSNQQNPAHQYAQTGFYQVKLIVTSESGCVDSVSRQVEVFEPPVAAYSHILEPCSNGRISFTDESTAHHTSLAEWYWEFEPGYNSTLRNPVHHFQQTDTSYAVSLTVTDGRGCINTVIDTVFVPAGLEVEINSTTACFRESMLFEPELISPEGDTLLQFKWDFGDPASGINNTSTLRNPEHLFLSPGAYTVKLEAMDQSGCWTTVYKQVTVDPLPIPDFSFESFRCDSSVYFTDLSLGNGAPVDYWIWNYGDGKAADTIFNPSSPNVAHVYDEPGYYNVQLIVVTTNGCMDTITKEVYREHCIEAGISVMDTLVCQGFELTFADSSANTAMIEQWTWDFGDGSDTTYNSFAPAVTHSYHSPGEKTVVLHVTSNMNGSFLTDSIFCVVNVLPTPKPDFIAENVCFNQETEFNNITEFNNCESDTWLWDFGVKDSCITSDLPSPVYKYETADTFDVKLRVTATNGCYDSIIKQTVVNPLPVADFEWELACRSVPTSFFDLSDASLAENTSWSWNFGDSLTKMDTSTLRDPQYIYDSTGIYYPKVVVGNIHGCTDTIQQKIEVYPVPHSAFSYEENYDDVQGQLQFLNETKEAESYWWIFGDGGDSEEVHPVYQFTEDGEYEILLISTNEYGCPDSLKMTYNFMFKGLFVPNAFAPENPAAEVRVFKPKGINLLEYELMIFDSWGQQIWSSDKLDDAGMPIEGWDGTYNGQELPMDTYLWKIKAKFKDGSLWEGKSIGNNEGGAEETSGTVTLIR